MTSPSPIGNKKLSKPTYKKADILNALYWMYSQYCSGGHDFMSAGEEASEILEHYDFIEVDSAGRILLDNGEQL